MFIFIIIILFVEKRNPSKLLETKLQAAEHPCTNVREEGGVTKASIVEKTEDASGTTVDDGEESTKKDAACAIFPKEEDIKHHDGAGTQVNDNKKKLESKVDESLVTFSRQKLALLQCEYDPKRCLFCENFCTQLKQCTRCKTAKYCSRECQLKDWEKRHKKDCREIRRLQENIVDKIRNTMSTVKLCDKPCPLEKTMEYGILHLHEGKLLMSGFQPLQVTGRFLDTYNPVTFEKESTVVRVEETFGISGFCTLTIDNSLLLAVAVNCVPIEKFLSRLELWSFPNPTEKPVYTQKGIYGPMCISEGKLLIVNGLHLTVEELDISSLPLRQTNVRVQTGITFPGSVQSICLIENNGEKQIVLQYLKDLGWEDSRMKCINYQGEEIWHLGGLDAPNLDGRSFQPYSICTDDEGNIYTAEQESKRIVLIKRDLSIQVLFDAPDRVGCIAWCNKTQKLYVVYDILEDVQMAIARYNVTIKG